MRTFGLALLLYIFVSCSSTTPSGTGSLMRSSGMVTVNVVGACPVRSLSGASVELRSSDSAPLAYALTGSDGSAAFSSAVFQRAAAIVVCHEDFFCGVLELTTHTGSRFFIALAPAMLSSSHIRDNERACQQYTAVVDGSGRKSRRDVAKREATWPQATSSMFPPVSAISRAPLLREIRPQDRRSSRSASSTSRPFRTQRALDSASL